MNGRLWILISAFCVPGLALQSAGVVRVLAPGVAELNLLVGFLLFAVGTSLSMYAVERTAEAKGRSGLWSFTALAGPFGPVAVVLLRRTVGPSPGGAAPGHALLSFSEGVPRTRSAADRVVGMALTVAIAAGLAWAAAWLLLGAVWPTEPSAADIPRNERFAFERLGTIIEAQRRYAQKDWDGDGRKIYAEFAVHLWQSVDSEGRPVKVGLIPRRLGFATVRTFSLDGYFYPPIHERQTAEGGRLENLRPADAWAVAACPITYRKTGVLTFLADSSGAIFAKDTRGDVPRAYPHDPSAGGWREIRSVDDIEAVRH